MDDKSSTRISKFMSLVLRHKPGTIGLTLDENGWASTEELIRKMNGNGFNVDEKIIEHVVSTNSKQRFGFNEDRSKIRANQGHSIDVELELEEKDPPEFLYHGTTHRFLDPILSSGIEKMSRQHVHLSADVETALKVGQRHGKPVILIVAARQMKEDGHRFFLSENKVWLTGKVPPKYLKTFQN